MLTGGVGTNCNTFDWDEFAKVATAWTGLAPYLDPDATGAVSLPGKDATLLPAIPLVPGWSLALAAALFLLVAAIGVSRTIAVPGPR